jgi:hypothetical protein
LVIINGREVDLSRETAIPDTLATALAKAIERAKVSGWTLEACRSVVAPELKTFADLTGQPGFEVAGWSAFVANAPPQAMVEALDCLRLSRLAPAHWLASVTELPDPVLEALSAAWAAAPTGLSGALLHLFDDARAGGFKRPVAWTHAVQAVCSVLSAARRSVTMAKEKTRAGVLCALANQPDVARAIEHASTTAQPERLPFVFVELLMAAGISPESQAVQAWLARADEDSDWKQRLRWAARVFEHVELQKRLASTTVKPLQEELARFKTMVQLRFDVLDAKERLDELDALAADLVARGVGRLVDESRSEARPWSRAVAAPYVGAHVYVAVDVGERGATPSDLAAVLRCADDLGLLYFEARLPWVEVLGMDDELADSLEVAIHSASPRVRTRALLPLFRARLTAQEQPAFEQALVLLEAWSMGATTDPQVLEDVHAELGWNDEDDEPAEIAELMRVLLDQLDPDSSPEELSETFVGAFLRTGAVVHNLPSAADSERPTEIRSAPPEIRQAILEAISVMNGEGEG